MQLPHDRECVEHLHGDGRIPLPVLAAEGDLGDLLARTEAVIRGAAGEAQRAEAVMNGAAEVRSQVRAWLPGLLADGEVRRRREGRGNTAQASAAAAVGPQAAALAARRGRRLAYLGQIEFPC
jgi:hypothetical protein